ncbi:hypothetical protein BGW39_010552 [Mortierella sp. 14UC]|nr:hypothetical protein BGW39_010552 [Mortierella sp. 14UC]
MATLSSVPEMTDEGKSTFDQLQTFAKVAVDASKGQGRSLRSVFAAVHVDQSKFMTQMGHPAHYDSADNDAVSTVAGNFSPVNTLAVQGAPILPAVMSAFEKQELMRTTLLEKELPPVPTINSTQHDIFPYNGYKPSIKMTLSEPGTRIHDTNQLVYCLSLLYKETVTPPFGFGSPRGDRYENWSWLRAMEQNSTERQHIDWLATRVVEEFVKDRLKSSDNIREVIHLAPILNQEHFRKLLNCFITDFELAALLDKDLLQGLVQLVQCAQPGYLCSDDLIKILKCLRLRLHGAHRQSNDHVYHLTLAVSRVLDVMAKHEIKDLNRVQEHEPLSAILCGLSGSSDPFLMYQASYAFQALQYITDNETTLQVVVRHAGGIAQGLFQAAAVVNLDVNGFLLALKQLRTTLVDSAGIAMEAYKGVCTLIEEGRRALDAVRDGLGSGSKRAWYPAVIVATTMVQEGRLADFRELVDKVDCRQDPAFQWAICQLLGDIALDIIWHIDTRRQAVEFLVKLQKADSDWGRDSSVNEWSLSVLRRISMDADSIVKDVALALLKDISIDDIDELNESYSLLSRLPPPSTSVLLARVQNIPSVEHELSQLRSQRLRESPPSVYIPPQAKATLNEAEDGTFPLMDRVKEFLASDRQVFLLLGDSGAGKSMFNRHLERDLWSAYQPGDPIPLLINLPIIEKPSEEMITKQLRRHNFSQEVIQELKEHRKFFIICDGYDESRLRINLHSTNSLNQPGQWSAKMIVTCRSTHVGQDYQSRFRPEPTDRYNITATAANNKLFQEAIIAPFSTDQIRSYVEQHVQDPEIRQLFRANPVWSVDEFMDKLAQIPNLLELVTNPFLLTMSLRALPIVVKDKLELSGIRITRLQIYNTFIDQWLEINRLRLQSKQLSAEAEAVLEELVEEGFIKVGIDFSKKLAGAIYEKQQGNPTVQYSHRSDKTSWKAQFFGPDTDITLLRESNPLTRSGSSHRFIHRSLLEYFYFRHISEHAVTYERVKQYISYICQPTPEQLRRQEEEDLRRPKELVGHPLLDVHLENEPEILQFLTDHVEEEPKYGLILQGIVDYAVENRGQMNSAVRNAKQILGQPKPTQQEEMFYQFGLKFL